METRCQSCNSKIAIADSKIPKGQAFSFACPTCKNKITIDPIEEKSAPAKAGKKSAPTSGSATGGASAEVFSPGDETPGALICDSNPAILKGMAEKMGYQVHAPKEHTEAINNIKFNDYNLIIITESYEKQPHDGDSILKYLQNVTMEKRRKAYVLYIGSGLKTFDGMQAFGLSVNGVYSAEEFAKQGAGIADALKRTIFDNQLSYKVYMETMISSRRI